MTDEISNIQTLINHELDALDAKLIHNIESQSPLANQVCQHLMHNSGKRIRPTVLILSAFASGYDPKHDDIHLELASVIEFLHTASLLHDDVIDEATTRRSLPAANTIWGNKACILTGDFLHARAFQITTTLGSQTVFEILSDAVKDIIEGELEQLRFNRDHTITKTQYLSIIGAKTARLFSVSCQLGGLISEGNYNDMDALCAYGHHLGMTFQIMDDLADYNTDSKIKSTGQDIASGVVTLPFIFAYADVNDADKIQMAELIKAPSTTINDIMPFIQKTQAINKCLQEANTAVDLAIESLANISDSPYKDALIKLAKSLLPTS